MSNKLSVYNQLIVSTDECLKSIEREIGIKTKCMPFAVKLIEALKTLDIKTDQEALNAANTLMSGLQTLHMGGIIPEDYDKIDFVKRGKTIVPGARVEAFMRAAARKGYRITDTIIAVPTADAESTYFKENFYNGDIIYTLEDLRKESDREVTADRLINGYFKKFICRLDIHDIDKNQRLTMVVCELSNAEILTIASASEQGIYKTKWEEFKNQWGQTKKRKVTTKELNTDTFWVKWTADMVNKSIIRKALKRVKEVLPELKETIYAFEHEDEYTDVPAVEPDIQIPVVESKEDVRLDKLTDEQMADCKELFELWRANPKLAQDKLTEIKGLCEEGADIQSIINEEYAAITVLSWSKTKWPQIARYFTNDKQSEKN